MTGFRSVWHKTCLPEAQDFVLGGLGVSCAHAKKPRRVSQFGLLLKNKTGMTQSTGSHKTIEKRPFANIDFCN